jgi:hypothetical protein
MPEDGVICFLLHNVEDLIQLREENNMARTASIARNERFTVFIRLFGLAFLAGSLATTVHAQQQVDGDCRLAPFRDRITKTGRETGNVFCHQRTRSGLPDCRRQLQRDPGWMRGFARGHSELEAGLQLPI